MVAVAGEEHHSKTCTSSSCCSPSRLWRTIHTLISDGNKRDLVKLFQDPERAPHVFRILLTARMTNDATQYPASHKHRVVQFDPSLRIEANRKFGKSVADLNAVQLALMYNREDIAIKLLNFIQQHAQTAELQLFLNHVWGNRNTTLHLACFLGMTRLVRLLLDLGMSPDVRNARRLLPSDCSTHRACLALLQERSVTKTSSTESGQSKPRASQKPATQSKREPKLTSPSKALQRKSAESPAPVTLATAMQLPNTAQSNPGLPTFSDDLQLKQHQEIVFDPPSMSRSSSLSSLSSSEEEDEGDGYGRSAGNVWSPPTSPALSRGSSIEDLRLASAEPKMASSQRQVRFDTQTVLVDACVRGDLDDVVDAVDSLTNMRLKKPPDIKKVSQISVGAQDRSLLHLALMHGHPQLVQYLVDSLHIDANRTDADGWTALHYAAALGNWDCFEFLASLKGVDVFAETDDGWTVLDCAETELDREYCRSLIDCAIGQV